MLRVVSIVSANVVVFDGVCVFFFKVIFVKRACFSSSRYLFCQSVIWQMWVSRNIFTNICLVPSNNNLDFWRDLKLFMKTYI